MPTACAGTCSLATLTSHEEVDKLLVLVGRDYVAGVSESLMKQHGWIELDVPGQKVGF